MGVTDSIKGAYFALEDRYYRMLDWVDEKGVPVYKVVDAIESAGIPSFPVFVILILVILYLLFSVLAGGLFAGNSVVTLTITDNQGTGIEGASVAIAVDQKTPVPLLSDAQGKVRREFPKNTQLSISVSKDGFIAQTRKLTVDSDTIEEKFILELQISSFSKTVNLVHGATGALFTSPVSVSFSCSANSSFSYQTTTNNGTITVENIPNDCGTLIATPNTAGIFFSAGTVDFLSPGIAQLSVSEENAAKGTVRVTLSDQSNQPASGVNVRLMRSTGTQAGVPFSSRTTTATGSALFDDVPVGRYYIVTYDPVNQKYADYDSSAVNDIKEVTVGQVTDFSATLSFVVTGKIRLSIKDAITKQPVPNVAVYLQKNGVTLTNTSSDLGGYVEFNVSDNANVYSVRVDNPSYLIATLNNLGKSDSIIEILLQPLTEGQQTTLEVLVTDQTNKPVENSQVLLKFSPSGDAASEVIGTGIDGKATFTRLEAGNYYAEVIKEGFESVTSSVVTVNERQINLLKVILPIGSGTVDVVVSDSTGALIKGASVRAVDQFSGQELEKKNTGVDGKASFVIRQDKKVFFEVTATGFARFTTVPVTPPADSTITINVTLRQDIVRFEVALDGLYVNGEKSSDALSAGQQYTARLLLLVPDNASLSEAGVHIRTGAAEERKTNLMESDYWNILKVNSAANSVLKGLSFSPPTGFSQDAGKVTTGTSKWANLVFKNPKGGVYQIEAQVQVLASAPTGATLPFSYRGWGKTGSSYVRFPVDVTLGDAESVPQKQGLYAKTNDKLFSVGPSSLCTPNFCYSLIIEDVAANVRSVVIDEYPAKSGLRYKLFFSLVNNSALTFSAANLEIANSNAGLNMDTYRVTDSQGAIKNGSFNGSSVSIPVADFRQDSSLFGEVAFATISDGSNGLDLTVKANSQVVFQKTIAINVEAAKPSVLNVLPKSLAPFLDNDLIIRFSELDQNKGIGGATVDILVNGELATSGLTDGSGIFHYTLQAPEPGAIVKVRAQKPGYKIGEKEWQVSTNILSIIPDSVDETLTVNGVFGFERDFTITNETQFPLRISNAGFSSDFNQLLLARFVEELGGTNLDAGKDNNFSIQVELTDLAKRLLAPTTVNGEMIIVTESPNTNLSWANRVPITVHIGFGGEVLDGKCLTVEPVNWPIRTSNTKPQTLEFKVTNNCQVQNGNVSLRNFEAFLQQPISQNPLGNFVLSGELTDGSALTNSPIDPFAIPSGINTLPFDQNAGLASETELNGQTANLQFSRPISITLTNKPQIIAPLLAANSESVLFITFTPDSSVQTGAGDVKIILRGQHVTNNGVQPIIAAIASTIQISDLAACVEIVPPQITVYSTSPGIGAGIYGQYGYGGPGYGSQYGAGYGGFGYGGGYGGGIGGGGFGGGQGGFGGGFGGGYGGYGGPYGGGSTGGISGIGSYGSGYSGINGGYGGLYGGQGSPIGGGQFGYSGQGGGAYGGFGSGLYGGGYNSYSGGQSGFGGINSGQNRFDYPGQFNNYQSGLQGGMGSVNGNPTSVGYPEQLYSNNYPFAGYSEPFYDTYSPVAANGSVPNYNGYLGGAGQQFGGQFGNFNQFNSMYGRNNQFRIINHCQTPVEISFEPDPALLVDQPVLNLEADAEQVVHVESTSFYGIYPLKVKGKIKDTKDIREQIGQLLVNVMPSGDPSMYDNCIQLNKRKFKFNDFVAKPQRATVINTCFAQGIRIDLDSVAFSNQGYGEQLAYETGNPGLVASVEPLNLQVVPTGQNQYYQVLDFELYKDIQYRPEQIPLGGSVTDQFIGIRSFANNAYNRSQGRAQLIVRYRTPEGQEGRKMFLVEMEDQWSILPQVPGIGNTNISPQQCVDPQALDFGSCLTDADFKDKKTYVYSERQALRIGNNPYQNIPRGISGVQGPLQGVSAGRYDPNFSDYQGVRNQPVSQMPFAPSINQSPYSTFQTNPLGPQNQPSYAATTVPQPYPYYAQNYTVGGVAPIGLPMEAMNVCSGSDNVQLKTQTFEVGGVKFTFETSAGKQSALSGQSGTSAIKLTIDKTNAKQAGEVRLSETLKAIVYRQAPFGSYNVEIPVKACVTLSGKGQNGTGPTVPKNPDNTTPGTPTVATKQADICKIDAKTATGEREYAASGLDLLLFNWNENLGFSADTQGKTCDTGSVPNYYCDGVQHSIELVKKTKLIQDKVDKELSVIKNANSTALGKVFGTKINEYKNTGHLVLWTHALSGAIADDAAFNGTSFTASGAATKESKAFFLKDNSTIALQSIERTSEIDGLLTAFQIATDSMEKIIKMQQILEKLAANEKYKNKIIVEVTFDQTTDKLTFINSAKALGAEEITVIPKIGNDQPRIVLAFTLNEFGYLHEQFKKCATTPTSAPTSTPTTTPATQPTACPITTKLATVSGPTQFDQKFLEALANASLTPKVPVAVTKDWKNDSDEAKKVNEKDATDLIKGLDHPQVDSLKALVSAKSNLIADNYSKNFKTDFATYYKSKGSSDFMALAATFSDWNITVSGTTTATPQTTTAPATTAPATTAPSTTTPTTTAPAVTTPTNGTTIDSGIYNVTIEYSWATPTGSATVKMAKAPATEQPKELKNPLLHYPLDATLQNTIGVRDYGTVFSGDGEKLVLATDGTTQVTPLKGTGGLKQFNLSVLEDMAIPALEQGRLFYMDNPNNAVYSPSVPYGFVLKHAAGKTGTLFQFEDAALNGKIKWAGVNEGSATPKVVCGIVGDSQYQYLNNNANGTLFLPVGLQQTTFSLACAANSATMTINQGTLFTNSPGAAKPTTLTATNKAQDLLSAAGTKTLPFETNAKIINLKDLASAVKASQVCVKSTKDSLELYWNPTYVLPPTSQAAGATVTTPAANTNANAPATAPAAGEKKKLVELINAERQAKNLPPFAENDFLNAQSQSWSEQMLSAGSLSHSNFAPENVATFFDSQGVGGIDAAQKLFDQWKNSPGHYQNMMTNGATQVGAGIACSATACYGTTQFANTD